jgi:hypothetical protein
MRRLVERTGLEGSSPKPLVPPESTRIPQASEFVETPKALSRAQAYHRHEFPVEIPSRSGPSCSNSSHSRMMLRPATEPRNVVALCRHAEL